jgi:hypothetical protein
LLDIQRAPSIVSADMIIETHDGYISASPGG